MPEDEMLTPELVHKQADEVAATAWKEKFGTDPTKPLLESPDLTRSEYSRLLKERDKVAGKYNQEGKSVEVNKSPVSTELDIDLERRVLKDIYQDLKRVLGTIGVETSRSNYQSRANKDIQLIGVGGSFHIEFAFPQDVEGTNEMLILHGFQDPEEDNQTVYEQIKIHSEGDARWFRESENGEPLQGEISDDIVDNKKEVVLACKRMLDLVSLPISEHPMEEIRARLQGAYDILYSYLESKGVKPIKEDDSVNSKIYKGIEIPGTTGTWDIQFLGLDEREKSATDKAHEAEIQLDHQENGVQKERMTIAQNGDAILVGSSSSPNEFRTFTFQKGGIISHYEEEKGPRIRFLDNPHGVLTEFSRLVEHLPKPNQVTQSEPEQKGGIRGFLRRLSGK